MIALLLSLVSFAGDAPVDSPLDSAVASLVSARHMDNCTPVFAVGDQALVRQALIGLTEVESPPWAPLRAAGCLAEMAVVDPVALAETRRLMSITDKPGFALVVTQKLDRMPEPMALELGTLAWQRSSADARLAKRIRPLVEASAHAPVRALAQ